ncbi:tectonin beta-propeller repeat-containing protein 2-like isoform X2 [Dendronephthya gigantea]|uniref:tectonin beta-propeller repeat-containing protein 2-like isoform X2 n=1 Tax=Dendronephthya gigantea TaxID=151771 RepID=UPI00106D17DF|nr:tectonin beta-propeller repeat-containing protein 2-like isoform X2 [Dendronephthya gigantea]
MVDINVIREECFLDEILAELPNRVTKPTPGVKGKNLKKIFHQFSDSLKDIQLQYTCLDVSSVALALGTNVGNAYVYQRKHRKILKISSETKYIPATCIKLATGCTTVAFGHECGTFSVGLVDPPIHKSFDSLTAQDIHHSSISCLEWSTDGLILYAGDSDGKISMSVVKISEGILQTAIIVTEDCSVVQICYGADSLLISTMKRAVLWLFQNESLVQVGEKERKTSGRFGGCFLPENIQEPTKKLYAARPGLRIWTAGSDGKVSSTSVFKSLLSEKPPVISTLIENDNKFSSNGQFGKLLVFYNQYVLSWDPSHIWVLDLDIGKVMGCHSNLGKIRDVSVSGHEVFVLLNQRERFLRRFVLATERVLDSSYLDAVKAGEEAIPTGAGKPGFNLGSALMKVPFMNVKTEDGTKEFESKDAEPEVSAPLAGASNSSTLEAAGATKSDIFDRINAIPLDEGPADIVFTAAKKKKKKKKTKQASPQVDGSASTEATEEPASNTTVKAAEERLENESEMTSNLEKMSLATHVEANEELSTILKDTNAVVSDTNGFQARTDDKQSRHVLSNDTPNQATTDKQVVGTPSLPEKDESSSVDIPGKTMEESTRVETKTETQPTTSTQPTTLATQPITSTIQPITSTIQPITSTIQPITSTIQPITSTIQPVTSTTQPITSTIQEHETQSAQKTEATNEMIAVQEIPTTELDIATTSTDPPQETSQTSRQDSSDSTDVYRTSTDILRLDSHEDDRSKSPETIGDHKTSTTPPREDHVPLVADTWSGRSLPTSQPIEHLAISQKYIFCIDNRSRVYFSDPNTASCSGWEKADFKAKQIFVNSSCDFICCLENGKAFVRGNISDASPVGTASFQILDQVSMVTTCSRCIWTLTVDNTLRRADTATLGKLKTDMKPSCSTWKIEDSRENLAQIACYENVLWGRTRDETVLVYPGRSGGIKTKWGEEEKKAKWLHMSDDGTAWIITPDDQIWFKPHVTTSCPAGEVWYQVTLGQYIIDDPTMLESTFNFFASVGSAYRNARTTEYLRNAAKGFLQSTKDMACSLFKDGGTPKQIFCNTQSGLWLLDTKNALHACRGQATGAYWDIVCPAGTAQSATWCEVTTGLAGYIWAIQPNGELTCFHPKGSSYNVQSPSERLQFDFMRGSPHGLWCLMSAHNSKAYIRDGISEDYPQGFAWTSLSLKHQEVISIKHFSVGRITVWAVDMSGQVWVRIGSVGGDESSALSQAWLPLDNPENIEFASVEVNCKDLMVWAVDTRGGVYARDGVDENYLVGQQWREVEGVILKSICLSSYLVYGLCTTEEIVCRFGVSGANCIGDYWKKLPGCFPKISVNSAGELWAISHEKKLYARKMKYLAFQRGELDNMKKSFDGNFESSDHDEGNGDDNEADWELL